MSDVKTTPGGQSAPESAIAMLRDAVRILRRHPRDAEATTLANRVHGFLARFPTHFVVEFLEQTPTGALLHRVPLSDWPEWSSKLARRLDLADLPQAPAVELEHQAFGVDAAPAVRRPLDRRAAGEVPATLEHYAFDGVPLPVDPFGDNPDQDTLVPGDGADALEAIQAIAELLGVPCTQEEIEEAILELKADSAASASALRGTRATEALRMLWLVAHQAGADGVVLPGRDLAATDWSRATLQRDDHPETRGIRLRAVLKCGTCGEPIKPDPVTGTACACSSRGPSHG